MSRECSFATMVYMEDEDRKLLEEVLELSRENQRMIKSMYRSQWWSRIWKSLYWIIILGIAFGSFYFLKPYLDKVMELFGKTQTTLDSVQKVTDVFSP